MNLDAIINQLIGAASVDVKNWHETYLKQQFYFYGVTKAQLKVIGAPLISYLKAAHDKALTKFYLEALWKLPERENQHLACMILMKCQAQFQASDALWIVNHLIKVKSWWDTIDTLRTPLARILDREGKTLSFALRQAQNKNMWVRRTAILLGPVSAQIDLVAQQRIISLTQDDKAFFIQKAIGWSLRDYAKFDMLGVVQAVANLGLKTLAKREALKHYVKPN